MSLHTIEQAEATLRRTITDRLPHLGLADLRVVSSLVAAIEERDFTGGVAAGRSYAGRLFERATRADRADAASPRTTEKR